MFSSLVSFLPTVLRDTQKAGSFVPDEGEGQRPEEPEAPQEVAQEPQAKAPQKRKRERERRQANELFVIVRPPPSKSNHPLNLQVQLVPPHSKGVLPRQSVDFEPAQPSSLYRSPSNRSQESSTTYGSTSSFASTASTATSSASSTRRAIVPLYNLQAHNVLPNVIVDAGTDAKVAKFQKRGIELVDLALLEPIEVWPDPNAVVMPVAVTAPTLAVPIVDPEASTSTLGRLSVDEMGFAQVNTRTANSGRSVAAFLAAPAGATSSRPTTPDGLVGNAASSSVPSISSGSHGAPESDHHPRLTTSPEPIQSPTAPPPSAGKRNNIFGKIFNKKNAKEPLSPVGGALTSPSVLSNANWKFSSGRAASPQVQQEGAGENPNISYDQSTPTQLEHNVTPTPHQHPYLGSKSTTPTPFDNNKRTGGIRGLLGSPSALKSPQQPSSSPLSAAFSTLGIKRRSLVYSGQAAEDNPSISLNEAEEISHAQPSAGLNSAHVLASVPQSNQAQPQPQPSQPVLSVQPTMCVVPASAIHAIASRSNRRPKSRSPDDNDDASRSVERNDANDTTTGKLPKDKEEKRGKIIRRAYMYVWLARKWIKRRPPLPSHSPNQRHPFGLGLPSGGAGKGLGIDATWMHLNKNRELGVEETVEVRFEWRRAPLNPSPKKKEAVASGEGAETGAGREAERLKRQSWHGGDMQSSQSRRRGEEEKRERREESRDNDNAERGRKQSASSISSARAAVKRWSLLSHQSMSTGGASEDGDADSGNESDPEDSETPWVCTLKVRRTNLAAAKEANLEFTASLSSKGARGRSNGGGGEGNEATGKSQGQEVLRIKVGVLSPTPHHPKVVAMLKVPFPLPDVQIERLEVVKRRGLGPSQSGTTLDANGDGYYGLTLTAEEIKDVVCSTSLWLVVRESIGGVGKVQRKGDGWLIRS